MTEVVEFQNGTDGFKKTKDIKPLIERFKAQGWTIRPLIAGKLVIYEAKHKTAIVTFTNYGEVSSYKKESNDDRVKINFLVDQLIKWRR